MVTGIVIGSQTGRVGRRDSTNSTRGVPRSRLVAACGARPHSRGFAPSALAVGSAVRWVWRPVRGRARAGARAARGGDRHPRRDRAGNGDRCAGALRARGAHGRPVHRSFSGARLGGERVDRRDPRGIRELVGGDALDRGGTSVAAEGDRPANPARRRLRRSARLRARAARGGPRSPRLAVRRRAPAAAPGAGPERSGGGRLRAPTEHRHARLGQRAEREDHADGGRGAHRPGAVRGARGLLLPGRRPHGGDRDPKGIEPDQVRPPDGGRSAEPRLQLDPEPVRLGGRDRRRSACESAAGSACRRLVVAVRVARRDLSDGDGRLQTAGRR